MRFAVSPEKLQFPAAYCDGNAYFIEPADTHLRNFLTYFGGPLDMRFTGIQYGPHRLHRVLTLDDSMIPGLKEHTVSSMPLFYGLRFSGCRLMYRVRRRSVCHITEIEPRRSLRDWPYLDYPPLLPYIPLRLQRRISCTPQRFAKLSWQGLDIGLKNLVAIVPPIPVGGVSLWGPTGDAEGVQIIFECDLENQIIKASNQCT